MKKRFLKVIAVAFAVMLVSVAFTGCKLSEEERAVVGKYEIVQLSVTSTDLEKDYSYIGEYSYEFYTMEFKSNKKCLINRRADGKTVSLNANWSINDFGEVEVVTVKNRAKAIEIYTLDGEDMLVGKNSAMVGEEEIVISTTFLRTYE